MGDGAAEVVWSGLDACAGGSITSGSTALDLSKLHLQVAGDQGFLTRNESWKESTDYADFRRFSFK